MKLHPRRFVTSATAVVASLALSASLVPSVAAQSLPAQSAQLAVVERASSELGQMSSDLVGPVGITLPATSAPNETSTWDADGVEGRLLTATQRHLSDMGHRPDPHAWDIAAEWAGQAARGEVEYRGGVGRGNTHLEEGTGQIYQLTVDEAKQRVVWLDRPANPVDPTHRFGVATHRDGDIVYLVEYFLY